MSRLPEVTLINIFGEVKHTNRGFAIYTKFLRDSLHVIGEDLQVPQLLRDRSDLRYFGCLESQEAFSRWGVSDLILEVLPHPTWWHIADNRQRAYSALDDSIDMTEEDFGIMIMKQRSDWSKDFWDAHPEKREELSQRMHDFWDAHPEKREELSQRMHDYWAHPEKREEMSQRMHDFWDAHPEKREEVSHRMHDFWDAHPEKREELSQRMHDFWDAHPEKREEASQRMHDLYTHPEKREEVSQRMHDFWDAHPEKREEASQRKLALEAVGAPGSCTALHANPTWDANFREATRNRWKTADYRAHMMEILCQERPKMKATLLLKWQNPELRTAMLVHVRTLLVAKKDADEARAAELTLRFKDGSMTGVERVTILELAKQRRKSRIRYDYKTVLHAASDALATLIEDFYSTEPGQYELDKKEAYSDPAQVETRRLYKENARTKRQEHRTQPVEIDKKRSALSKQRWIALTPDERAVRISKLTAVANEKKLLADKERDSMLLEFREGRMDARTRIELVREYKNRAHARKKQGCSTSTTPCSDKLAEEIISWWQEDPSRNKADQQASRHHDAIQNAIKLLQQFASGTISAEDRWSAHRKAIDRAYQRVRTGSTADDPPAMKELAHLIKEYYDANPLEAQKDKKISAGVVSKKQRIHENET